MSVLRLVLVCLMVASALAADVEVDTEVEYTSAAALDVALDVEADKPKRVAVNASLPVKVLDKSLFMPKSRVVLVPKGDPRARRDFFDGEVRPIISGDRHHRHHRHHHREQREHNAEHRPHHRVHSRAGHHDVRRDAVRHDAPRRHDRHQPRVVTDRRRLDVSTKFPFMPLQQPRAILKSGAPAHHRAAAHRPAVAHRPHAKPTAPIAAAAAAASSADCPVYANAPTSPMVGNGNAHYSVVRIAPQHFTGTADNTMTKPTACAFARMAAAAAKAGVKLTISSGFRSLARQQYFWNCFRSKKCNGGHRAAKPGASNHGRGVALDINTGPLGAPVYKWMAANAAAFGFRRTVSDEPWHWEHSN